MTQYSLEPQQVEYLVDIIRCSHNELGQYMLMLKDETRYREWTPEYRKDELKESEDRHRLNLDLLNILGAPL